MYRSNTNIIGFLQKKAFFNRSPSPSTSPNSRFATQPRNVSPNKPSTINRSQSRVVPINRNIFEVGEAQTKKTLRIQQNSKADLKQAESARKFQSSRVEIRMCIQDLSARIASELKLLEASISELTVSLQTQFHKRLSQLKQDLLTQIQQTFTQARNNLNNILSSNNQKHLKQLLLSKRELGDHQRKLKQYKNGLQSNWRKIAGELFSTDSDQKIQKAIFQSEKFRRALNIKPNEGPPQQETHFWQSIKTNIQSLVQKRCR